LETELNNVNKKLEKKKDLKNNLKIKEEILLIKEKEI
jgi:hypothetical protein